MLTATMKFNLFSFALLHFLILLGLRLTSFLVNSYKTIKLMIDKIISYFGVKCIFLFVFVM